VRKVVTNVVCLSCGRDAPAGPWCPACGGALAERAGVPQQPGAGPYLPPPPGPPGWCQECGGAPALPVLFRQNIGLLLFRQARQRSGVYCRDCGQAVGRRMQSATLVTGWWGLLSAFVNVAAVATNGQTLQKLRRLGPPAGGDPARRLRRGRSVLLRAGLLVPLALVLVAATAVVAGISAGPTVAGFHAGDCFLVGDDDGIKVANCDAPHDGTVLAVVSSADACPRGTDDVFRREHASQGNVLCAAYAE
jgi:hypothetical protein